MSITVFPLMDARVLFSFQRTFDPAVKRSLRLNTADVYKSVRSATVIGFIMRTVL